MGVVMSKIAGALLLALTLASCATNAPLGRAGWTPQANATPYDAAAQECHDRTQSNSGPGYEECMAGLGWTPAAAH
jgi:hypothetical protein